jgi:hypothetical protein
VQLHNLDEQLVRRQASKTGGKKQSESLGDDRRVEITLQRRDGRNRKNEVALG